jgi:3-hexulose-6-phosphate synthase
MKLQLAMDFCKNYENTCNILREVHQFVDIVELGTPLLMECGLPLVEQVKKEFPGITVLADLKIMDAGWYETEAALQAGADIVTVMAVTETETVRGAVECAKKYGKEIMVDLLAVKEIEKRIGEMEELGVHYICLHTSKDLQREGMSAAETFAGLKKFITSSKIALAGGITAETVQDYVALQPDVVIVGEGIMSQEDKVGKAKQIKGYLG